MALVEINDLGAVVKAIDELKKEIQKLKGGSEVVLLGRAKQDDITLEDVETMADALRNLKKLGFKTVKLQ